MFHGAEVYDDDDDSDDEAAPDDDDDDDDSSSSCSELDDTNPVSPVAQTNKDNDTVQNPGQKGQTDMSQDDWTDNNGNNTDSQKQEEEQQPQGNSDALGSCQTV